MSRSCSFGGVDEETGGERANVAGLDEGGGARAWAAGRTSPSVRPPVLRALHGLCP
jgi:hypothetical protein